MISVPLKYAADLNSRVLPEETDGGYAFRYVDISQVNGNGHVELPEDEISFASAPSRARRIARPGDTVISTVRTYLRAIAPVPNTADQLVFSTGFAVASPREGTDGHFLSWACQSDGFVSQVVARSVGVSYPAINPSELAMIPVPLPPLDAQRQVADFLDEQVALIDKAVDARKRQVDLVTVRLHSVLDEEFRLDLPANAQWRPLRSLMDYFQDGDWIEAPFITDTGIRLIQTGNVTPGEYREQGYKYISEHTYKALRCKPVLPGDVLISRLSSPVARACIAPDLGVKTITSVDVVIARPNQDLLSNDYLVYYLSSPKHLSDSDMLARGATMQRLSRSQVGMLRIPVIDKNEQHKKVSRIHEAWEETRQAQALMTRSIELLQERKRSLITAAVTGEIDVTTASNHAARTVLSNTGDPA